VALEAAHRLDPALAFSFLALQISTGGRVDAAAGDRDDLQRVVGLAVAAAAAAASVM
jgi:hypothetical protein